MIDETEEFRRAEVQRINSEAAERAALEAKYGQVWNTNEVTSEFTIISFLAPYVLARRNKDNKKGTLEFQDRPRYYFNFREG